MPKYRVGGLSGAVITGLVLTLFGRLLFPELSLTYRVIWLLIAGTITGVFAGIAGHKISHPVFHISMVLALGIFTFGIFGVILDVSIIYSLVTGGMTGVLTGFLTHKFGSNSWVINTKSQV